MLPWGIREVVTQTFDSVSSMGNLYSKSLQFGAVQLLTEGESNAGASVDASVDRGAGV